jgi:excisionase family DNA binding protein
MSRLEDLPPVLTAKEVAEAFRVHVIEVRHLIGAGKLRATNIGRGRRPSYRILREDAIAYLRGDTSQGASESTNTRTSTRKAA